MDSKPFIAPICSELPVRVLPSGLNSSELYPWPLTSSKKIFGTQANKCGFYLCRSPAVIAAGLGVAALTIGLLTDWHRTLQLIGTNGILLTLLARTTSYERPQVQRPWDSRFLSQLCETGAGSLADFFVCGDLVRRARSRCREQSVQYLVHDVAGPAG